MPGAGIEPSQIERFKSLGFQSVHLSGIQKKEWNTTSRYQIAINNIYHIEKKILNPVRKISLPWLQSQWIVDFALSIDNTMTFSEKFEPRYWQFFEEYEYYGHMILVSYHRVSIQKPWEAKSDLEVWMNRLSQSLSKCNNLKLIINFGSSSEYGTK